VLVASKRVTAGHTVVNGGGKQRAPSERGVKALQSSVMQGWLHALQPESQRLRSVCWWPANGSRQGIPLRMVGEAKGSKRARSESSAGLCDAGVAGMPCNLNHKGCAECETGCQQTGHGRAYRWEGRGEAKGSKRARSESSAGLCGAGVAACLAT
jgi:hypothetical protein